MAKVGILLTMVLAVTVSLLAAGCDRVENPLMVQNDVDTTIYFRALSAWDSKVKVATEATGFEAAERVELSSGEETEVRLGGTHGMPQYTFIVETEDGSELFRRTLTMKELYERDWHIAINGAGIE